MNSLRLLLITLLVTLSPISKSAYFENINGFTDDNCPEWHLERFDNVRDWFTVGVKGSIPFGFDYEVAISRNGVDDIWCALVPDRGIDNKYCNRVALFSERPFVGMRNLTPIEDGMNFLNLETQYDYYLQSVNELTELENIEYPNVGGVLELILRHHLSDVIDKYPKDRYSIASGIAYSNSEFTRTVGELDVIVFENQTCKVIAIGEAKASTETRRSKSLAKAKIQLDRFREFLRRQLIRKRRNK